MDTPLSRGLASELHWMVKSWRRTFLLIFGLAGIGLALLHGEELLPWTIFWSLIHQFLMAVMTVMQAILIVAWVEVRVPGLSRWVLRLVYVVALLAVMIRSPMWDAALVVDATHSAVTDLIGDKVFIAGWYRPEFKGLSQDPVTGFQMGTPWRCSRAGYDVRHVNPYYPVFVAVLQMLRRQEVAPLTRLAPTRSEAWYRFRREARDLPSLDPAGQDSLLGLMQESASLDGHWGARRITLREAGSGLRMAQIENDITLVGYWRDPQDPMIVSTGGVLVVDVYLTGRRVFLGQYSISGSEMQHEERTSMGWL